MARTSTPRSRPAARMISSTRSVPGRPGGHGGKLTPPEKRAAVPAPDGRGPRLSLAPQARPLQAPDGVSATRLDADDLAGGRRQPLLVGVEDDTDVRLRPGPRPRLLVRPQRIQQRGQPTLHVVHARAPRAALSVDAKRALLGRARWEHGVVVTHEEEALGPGARLVADQMITESVVDDPANT